MVLKDVIYKSDNEDLVRHLAVAKSVQSWLLAVGAAFLHASLIFSHRNLSPERRKQLPFLGINKKSKQKRKKKA